MTAMTNVLPPDEELHELDERQLVCDKCGDREPPKSGRAPGPPLPPDPHRVGDKCRWSYCTGHYKLLGLDEKKG